MSTRAPLPQAPSKRRLWSLVLPLACAVVAAGSGYIVGVGYSTRSAWSEKLENPLVRLGYRMAIEPSRLAKVFPPLARDLAAIEISLVEPEGKMLHLVVALHGLEKKGEPDLKRAGALCRELAWPRCDEAALRRMVEVLKK